MKISEFLFTIAMGAGAMQLSAIEFKEIKNSATLKFMDSTLADVQWRKVELPNGLQALLISDPSVDKSAISLSVNAGSMENPHEMPGVAHFLEHMITRGSSAFPDEAGYRTFITNNAGYSNAYTTMDHTCYMCEIKHEVLEEALLRTAHHFIDPLFYPGCVQREVNAVHQEYQMKISNDGRKTWRLMQHLMNQENPFSKFSTGNLETLADADDNVVREFWEKHYSAHQMHLVVVSKEPLDQIQDLVAPFEQIRVTDGTQRAQLPLFDETMKGTLVHQKPTADTRTLQLIWELPVEVLNNRAAKVEKLLSHIIGDEGPKSLTAHLKELGYITSLSAHGSIEADQAILFQITLDLTEDGLSDRQALTEAVFAGLNSLKSAPFNPQTVDDLNQLARIRYGYQKKQGAFERAKTHASRLISEPLPSYPDSFHLIQEKNESLYTTAFSHLTAENCIQWLIAPDEEAAEGSWEFEPIRHVHYRTEGLDQQALAALTDQPANPGIQPPPTNPWIPTDFSAKHSILTHETRTPKVLHSDDDHELLFIPDDLFGSPKAYVQSYLNAESVELGDAKMAVLLECAADCLNDQLRHITYPASQAGLTARLSATNEGLCYSFSGFSDKLLDLVKTLNYNATTAEEEVFQRQLEKRKERYSKKLREFAFRQAYAKLEEQTREHYISTQAKLDAAQDLTYDDYINALFSLADGNFSRTLIGGNITEDEAREIDNIIGWNEATPGLEHRTLGMRPMQPKPTTRKFSLNQKGSAPALQLYHGTVDYSTEGYRQRACHRIAGKLLNDNFFQDLRSKQGACYVALVRAQELDGHLVTRLVTQSTKLSCDELLARFELFLEGQVREAKESPEMQETFAALRESMIDELRQPYQTMQQVFNEVESLHIEREKEYHFKEKLAEALEALSWDEFQEFLINAIDRRRNPHRLAIFMQGEPSEDQLTPYSVE